MAHHGIARLRRRENLVTPNSAPPNPLLAGDVDKLERGATVGSAKRPGYFPDPRGPLNILYA